MTRRFYVEPGTLAEDRVELHGALAHRLAKVLRLRADDAVVLFDGSGHEARVSFDKVNERRATGNVTERFDGPPEPRVRVHLYQCITKGERFEWLVEKGTEIGVARFVPMIAARSVVKTTGEGNRLDRWRRIAVEAAEQCGRGAVPDVEPPTTFDAALAGAEGVLLIPYEEAGDSAPSVSEALNKDIDALFALGEVNIFIGPEGGLETPEVERAQATGATVVTLGSRVLRSETAGIVAATLALQAVGELG